MPTSTMRRHGRRAAGQSLTEVIVIVFLVGIGTIGVVGLFGDNLRSLFGTSSSSIAGNPGAANTGAEATDTSWDLRGGSVSAYSAGKPGGGGSHFNPGGANNGARPPTPSLPGGAR